MNKGDVVSRAKKFFDERTVALLLMAVSIVIGLLIPSLAQLFNPIALPALFLVVLFSLVPFSTLDKSDLVSINRSVWRVLLWQQVVLPSIVISIGVLCHLPDVVISLLVVTACSGALFASPALAALLDLDRRQSLQCMVLSTLLMPLTMYCFLSLFHGTNIMMDLKLYLQRIFIYLVIPAGMFLAYRWLAQRLPKEGIEKFEAVSRWAVVLALSVFGIGMMWQVLERYAVNPTQVLFFFGLTTVLCIGMLTITTIVMYRFGTSDALTAAILSGFRNVGLGYALIGDMIGQDLAVYVGVALLPVFIAPLLLKILAASRSMRSQAQPQY